MEKSYAESEILITLMNNDHTLYSNFVLAYKIILILYAFHTAYMYFVI